jgi:hypothetical protein
LPPLDKTANISNSAFLGPRNLEDEEVGGCISSATIKHIEADLTTTGIKSSLAGLSRERDGNQSPTLQSDNILGNLPSITSPDQDSIVIMRAANGSDGTKPGTTAGSHSFMAKILTKLLAGASTHTPKLLLPVSPIEADPNQVTTDLIWDGLSDLDRIIADPLLDKLIDPIKSFVSIGDSAGTTGYPVTFIAKSLTKLLAGAIKCTPPGILWFPFAEC